MGSVPIFAGQERDAVEQPQHGQPLRFTSGEQGISFQEQPGRHGLVDPQRGMLEHGLFHGEQKCIPRQAGIHLAVPQSVRFGLNSES
jgi:hypothetical protein